MNCPKCCHFMIKEEIWICDPPTTIYISYYKCTLCKYETEREENKMVAV
jgi:hypothetical protein